MDHITALKDFVCLGRCMFSHLSRYQNESKQPWGEFGFTMRVCRFKFFFFLLTLKLAIFTPRPIAKRFCTTVPR